MNVINNINNNYVINAKNEKKNEAAAKLLLHLLLSKLIIRNMNFIEFFGLIDLRKNINK